MSQGNYTAAVWGYLPSEPFHPKSTVQWYHRKVHSSDLVFFLVFLGFGVFFTEMILQLVMMDFRFPRFP